MTVGKNTAIRNHTATLAAIYGGLSGDCKHLMPALIPAGLPEQHPGVYAERAVSPLMGTFCKYYRQRRTWTPACYGSLCRTTWSIFTIRVS